VKSFVDVRLPMAVKRKHAASLGTLESASSAGDQAEGHE
jgi:hypothetical protein